MNVLLLLLDEIIAKSSNHPVVIRIIILSPMRALLAACRELAVDYDT